MNDVVLFKCVSIITIWIIGFSGGILPYFINKTNQSFMSILNCFSAGVFLAGGYMHLLHAAMENEGLKRWSTIQDGKYAFPYAELFASLGFLAVFGVEQYAHAIQANQVSRVTICAGKQKEDSDIPFLTNIEEGVELAEMETRSRMKSHDHNPFPASGNPAIAFVLFIALSFHSIMEGLGIGAQSTSAWGVFFAIIVHKGLAAFALGSGMLRSQVGKSKFLSYMFLFSLMSIIGILIGWMIASEEAEDGAAAGICLALASGTFNYVAVMEVIPSEFGNRLHIQPKMIALCMGYFIFGIIAKWA